MSSHRELAPRPPGRTFSSAILAGTVDSLTGTPNDEENSGRPAKRTRVACQHCRQSKLRCGGSNGGNQPCQRCSELAHPCVFDTGYKRVSKRTTLNDLASHVELLKAAGGLSRHGDSMPPAIDTHRAGQLASPDSHTSPVSAPGASASLSLHASQQHSQDWSMYPQSNAPSADIPSEARPSSVEQMPLNLSTSSNLATSSPCTIGTVTLSPDQVKCFFERYYLSYDPLFPVLPSHVSADSVLKSSPLLFWTIILTASRHDSNDLSLLQTLIPAVKKLLCSTVANVPHTLPSLQAMAILCVWTFPVSSMPLDITYLLSGMLKSAATHVGLHRPDILTHYSRTRVSLKSPELFQAAKAWCCIYVAIEGVAVGNGHQPFLPNDRTIKRASLESNPYRLPESLHIAVITQLFCNRVHLAMDDVDESELSPTRSCRSSLIKVLESDLRDLETRLQKFKAHIANVYLLSACFQLRAYWLFDDEDSARRREGVINAFDASLKLIDELQKREDTDSPARYLTFFHLRVSFVAAIFISKVVNSSYRRYVDENLGKKAFNTSISIFKKASVEDNDMHGRTTKVLVQLWNIHDDLCKESPHSPPGLSLKSRLFFSIAHDALWQWRERYDGQPSNGAPKLPPPVISPVSADIPFDQIASNQPDPSSRSRRVNAVLDNPLPGDHTDASSLATRQLPSPSAFAIANSGQEPWESAGQHDPFIADTGLINPGAMDFDLLFPDLGIPLSAQAWMQPMPEET